MNARVAELLTIITDAQLELSQIRFTCNHPSYYVGWWSWRPGAIHPSRICNECLNLIPGITPEEDEEFRKSQEGQFQVSSGTDIAL